MKWFGPEPFGPVCETVARMATPLTVCTWCEEPFVATDKGLTLPHTTAAGDAREVAYHQECFLRQVIGSIGHQAQNCSCHDGTDHDPPELSRREAARWAMEMFYACPPEPGDEP